MEKQVVITLTETEIELLQDSLAIAETYLRKSEMGKIMGIDLKILKKKMWEQIKPQVKK